MSTVDPSTRCEAIRNLKIMRDAHLYEWSTCCGTYHRAAARDLHSAIEIISGDAGLPCEPFDVVAARGRQARWLPPAEYPDTSSAGDQP